jgi:hypothetical protein
MNALYHFNRLKAQEKAKERARLAEETKRNSQEQVQMKHKSEYSSSSLTCEDQAKPSKKIKNEIPSSDTK